MFQRRICSALDGFRRYRGKREVAVLWLRTNAAVFNWLWFRDETFVTAVSKMNLFLLGDVLGNQPAFGRKVRKGKDFKVFPQFQSFYLVVNDSANSDVRTNLVCHVWPHTLLCLLRFDRYLKVLSQWQTNGRRSAKDFVRNFLWKEKKLETHRNAWLCVASTRRLIENISSRV